MSSTTKTFFFLAVLYRYSAANGPWMASVVAVRKYVLNGRALSPLSHLSPWVRAGLVFTETSDTWAASNTFCMDWATEEFSGPTTPRTLLSATSLVAFCWPEEGCAWSSRAWILKVTPGTSLFLLACLTARSTEFFMPRPRAESSPVNGASKPMVTTVEPSPEASLALPVSREPHAVSESAPAASAAVTAMRERLRTIGPFPFESLTALGPKIGPLARRLA